MNICAFTCAAMIAAIPAWSEEPGRKVELVPGHAVYHEHEREAGVVMALSITPDREGAADLMALCDELQAAAGLSGERGDAPRGSRGRR